MRTKLLITLVAFLGVGLGLGPPGLLAQPCAGFESIAGDNAGEPIPASGTSGDFIGSNAVVSGSGIIGVDAEIVSVEINLTHTFDNDLDISLVAPSGAEVDLSSDNGGAGDDYIGTIFDDNAATSIVDGSPPFTGTFMPEESMNGTLAGEQVNGTWMLKIVDDLGGDSGTFLGFTLNICAGGLPGGGDCDDSFSVNGDSEGNPLPDIGTSGGFVSEAIVSESGTLGTDYEIGAVVVDLDHTFDGDLEIDLVSPAGTRLSLSDNNGGAGDDYENTTFRDGGDDITLASPPFPGIYEPDGGPFSSAFAGESVTGIWRLEIEDVFAGDSGTFGSFMMDFDCLDDAGCDNQIAADGDSEGDPLPDIGTSGGFVSEAIVSEFAIVGSSAEITSVELDLDHTFDGDLEIDLVSPAGTRLSLSDNNGGAGDDYENTTFRDGGDDITLASAPFPGTYQPDGGTLNGAFAGENINGIWRLEIEDIFAGDSGTFGSWRLNICADECDTAAEGPTVNCSGPNRNVTFPNDPTECGAWIDFAAENLIPDYDDNCGVEILEFRYREVEVGTNNAWIGPWSAWIQLDPNDPQFADFFDVGRYRIRWRVKDAAGNQDACNRYIQIDDVDPPDITCNNHTINFNGEPLIWLDPADLVTVDFENCSVDLIELDPEYILCEQLGDVVPVTVTVTDVNGLSSVCTSLVTVDGLPCGWYTTPEMVDCDGEADYDVPSETFYLSTMDCHNPNTNPDDEYGFIQRRLCGDGSITAQVTSLTGNADGWAGVMMRESNDVGAPSVSLMTNLANRHRIELRTTPNGVVTSSHPPSFNRHWLRLVRFGNNFVGYTSFNGLQWYMRFTIYIPMGECIEIGLNLNSQWSTGDHTATFNNVSTTGGGVAPLQAMPDAPVFSPDYERTVTAFPNPTTGMTTLALNGFQDRTADLEVVNTFGQVVYQRPLGVIESRTEQVDLSELPAGVYYIRLLLDEGETEVMQLIKQ